MDFLGDKSIEILVVPGALGGLVRWLTMRSSLTDGIIAIIVGAICSLYVSPLVLPMLVPLLDMLHVDIDSAKGLSGFVAGLGGLSISGLIIDFVQLRTKALMKRAEAEPDAAETGGKAP